MTPIVCDTYYHVFMIMKLITSYILLHNRNNRIFSPNRSHFNSNFELQIDRPLVRNGISVDLKLFTHSGHINHSNTKIKCTFKNKLMKKEIATNQSNRELNLHSLITAFFLVM